MKIWGDYHTHTTFSHGKGKVIENALSAKEKALQKLQLQTMALATFCMA